MWPGRGLPLADLGRGLTQPAAVRAGFQVSASTASWRPPLPQEPLSAQPEAPRRGEPATAAPGPQPGPGALTRSTFCQFVFAQYSQFGC